MSGLNDLDVHTLNRLYQQGNWQTKNEITGIMGAKQMAIEVASKLKPVKRSE